MHIFLQNSAGVTKNVKVGFSWTTLFFGFFPALFRGDLKWAAIMFLISVAVGIFTVGFGAWISGIVFSFVYNKSTLKSCSKKATVLQTLKLKRFWKVTRLLLEQHKTKQYMDEHSNYKLLDFYCRYTNQQSC